MDQAFETLVWTFDMRESEVCSLILSTACVIRRAKASDGQHITELYVHGSPSPQVVMLGWSVAEREDIIQSVLEYWNDESRFDDLVNAHNTNHQG